MNTSYFASPKILKREYKLVSVSQKPPDWIKVDLIYKKLCPSWNLVMPYKEGKITKEQYTERYYNEVLNKLDPARTYEELGEDAILLCYEKSMQFCHRHIVSKWLMDHLNIIITEL